MIIDTAGPMAYSLRPTANGHRHFRLQIVDCRFAGAASREPYDESGPPVTRFDAGGKAKSSWIDDCRLPIGRREGSIIHLTGPACPLPSPRSASCS